jgi:hypothetical protein
MPSAGDRGHQAAAALAGAALASATLCAAALGATPPSGTQAAAAASLVLAASIALASAAVARASGAPALAVAVTASGSQLSGAVAGLMGWPHSEPSWLMALTSSWLAATTLKAGVSAHDHGTWWAASLPMGIIVGSKDATSCAWRSPEGDVRTWAAPPGRLAALAALWTMTAQGVLWPLAHGKRPRLSSLRRTHAAEHIAVLEAAGEHRVHHITPFCGGTVTAIALPICLLAAAAAPPGARGAAAAWAAMTALVRPRGSPCNPQPPVAARPRPVAATPHHRCPGPGRPGTGPGRGKRMPLAH